MAKAHSLIQLSLSDEVLKEVIDKMDAVSLLKKLEGKWQKKSLTNHLHKKTFVYLEND